MTTDQLKTVLAVMNLTAPFDAVWCAEEETTGTLDGDWGIQKRYRFYLVSDAAKLLGEEEIISV